MKILRNPHFWIILVLFMDSVSCNMWTILASRKPHHPANNGWLTAQSAGRLLFLIPIIYAGWVFGFSGGLAITVAAFIVSAPATFFISPIRTDAILETITIAAVGAFVMFHDKVKKSNKKYEPLKLRTELEDTRKTLQQKLDALTISEKRLGMLNAISATLYGSMELTGVFDKAVHLVNELMSAQITMLFISDESPRNWN